MNIGFIGLGKMGEAMADNLLKSGHQLTVYNRTRKKAERLEKAGARVASTPAAAAHDVEVVFTMLADDDALSGVVFGPNGITGALNPGAAHISSSTISTALARRLDHEHSKRKQVLVSAPVFGRPDAAAGKKLLVIAAGEGAAVERFRPLFEAIGRQTLFAGSEPWHANAVKICGNFMIAAMLEAFGEAFAVLRKSGVDHHVFLEAMREIFNSPVYANYGGIIANGTFEPNFGLALGLKDVRLALETAQEAQAPMPFASLLRDQFLSALANGQGELDWSSIALVAARNAGINLQGVFEKASSKSA
jgi:3-hydroxyisobutyrate dehydrogenase-like beta-hydroxyacid dehydrogenase